MAEDLEVTVAGLRSWARGSYPDEAAVELLARALEGRLASSGWPWVRSDSGWYWIDPEAAVLESGMLSGGERRLLAVVAALTGGPPVADLGGTLAGLDRANQALVLAALSHAGGSHEHKAVRLTADGPVPEPLGPLLDWPVGKPSECDSSGGPEMNAATSTNTSSARPTPAYVALQASYERPPGPVPSRVPGQPRRVVPMWRGSEAGREGHRRTRTGSGVVAKERPAWAIAADRSEVAGLVPACTGTDPRPWFDSKKWSDIRACVLLCAVCPVRSACLAGALARKEQFGVWGGVRFRGLGVADGGGDHRRVVFDDGGAKKPVLSREGKRRIFVGRLVRSIGKPVRVPGPWYVGPWTDHDHARGIERMRFILPANLRDVPMPWWPRELRLLFQFPDDEAIGADGQVR